MLLPAHLVSATKRMSPATALTPPPAAASVERGQDLSHTDYDLHPLTVRNLEHYIERDHAGERFHVR
jgi:hypothetical protein